MINTTFSIISFVSELKILFSLFLFALIWGFLPILQFLPLKHNLRLFCVLTYIKLFLLFTTMQIAYRALHVRAKHGISICVDNCK